MKKINITLIQPGDSLAEPAVNADGRLIFPEGAVLQTPDIRELMEHGITEVTIKVGKTKTSLNQANELYKFYNCSTKEDLIKTMRNEAVKRFAGSKKNPVMQEIMRLSIRYRLKLYNID